MNVDKAFIQFAGPTAGRAASFLDFCAHDFAFSSATAGSDVASTNLFAYAATFGNGLAATPSVEDPVYRRPPIFSPTSPAGTAASPVVGYNSGGVPTVVSSIDTGQHDFQARPGRAFFMTGPGASANCARSGGAGIDRDPEIPRSATAQRDGWSSMRRPIRMPFLRLESDRADRQSMCTRGE